MAAKRRPLLLLGGLGALAAACGIRKPPSPDPGGKRLRRLASDPVVTTLPHGAKRTSWKESPATYDKGNMFQHGAWSGSSLRMTFTSTLSVRDVYHFYAEQADEAGWKPWKKLPEGFTASWVKQIDTGQDLIRLFPHDFDNHSVDLTENGIPRSYRLTGSVLSKRIDTQGS